MTKNTAIKLFDQKQIRSLWNEEQEKWFFSIVDVIGVLSESENPNNYWKVLKNRLKKEGSELVTNCNQLKMQSKDGKYYKTDVADTEQLFRLIQSVPSPNAEPFKVWLAKVGRERIDEIEDPEIGLKAYYKGLKKENLRDHMTNLELVLNMLAEASTTEISKDKKPKTFTENKEVARKGGNVAKAARVLLEKTTGKEVVTRLNARQIKNSILKSDTNDN